MGRLDDMLNELKEKEKVLKKAYRGETKDFSDSTREYYSTLTKQEILSKIQEVKNEIKKVKKEAWKAAGKESRREDEMKDEYSKIGVNRFD